MEVFFSYGFFQRALVAGVSIAGACALLGVFLTLRRDAMIGHGLAHVAFAGVALGIFLGILPLAGALLIAVGASWGMVKLKEKAGLYGDTAIAIFSSVGFALGILLVTLAQRFNVDLFAYLFGEILAIKQSEVWLSMVVAGIVVLFIILNYHRLMYMTFDWEAAKASGINISHLDMLLTILTAVTIVMGMKVVGILLVSALIVIPPATSLQFATNFKQAMVFSFFISTSSLFSGLIVSFVLDIPTSATIVIISFLFFLLSSCFKQKIFF